MELGILGVYSLLLYVPHQSKTIIELAICGIADNSTLKEENNGVSELTQVFQCTGDYQGCRPAH